MCPVNDHGIEVLKKSGEEVTPGNKTSYYLKTKDSATITALEEIILKLQTLLDQTDGLEGFTDGIEGLLTTIRDNADTLESLITTLNSQTDQLEGYLDTVETKLGDVAELAPITDTASSGLNGRLQRIAQRITSLIALVPASLGAKLKAGSFSVVPAEEITYRASATFSAASTATDIFVITGSASKKVEISKIEIYCSTTTEIVVTADLIKRSTDNTGGTSAVSTNVPLDSTSASATAVVRSYTVNPAALGTAVGSISKFKLLPASDAFYTEGIVINFGQNNCQPCVLRGTSEILAVNINAATIVNDSFSISIEWKEI